MEQMSLTLSQMSSKLPRRGHAARKAPDEKDVVAPVEKRSFGAPVKGLQTGMIGAVNESRIAALEGETVVPDDNDQGHKPTHPALMAYKIMHDTIAKQTLAQIANIKA